MDPWLPVGSRRAGGWAEGIEGADAWGRKRRPEGEENNVGSVGDKDEE